MGHVDRESVASLISEVIGSAQSSDHHVGFRYNKVTNRGSMAEIIMHHHLLLLLMYIAIFRVQRK